MTALKKYQDLPIGPGSEIYKRLMESAASEVADEIVLSVEGEMGSPAGGLTPNMKAWFQTNIAPVRTEAISQVNQDAEAVEVQAGAKGYIERVAVDRAKSHRTNRRTEILSRFQEDNTTLIEDLETAKREYGALRVEQGNRDAKVPSRLLEWGVLFPIILIPESLLNFESFRRAPLIQSDFQALGATLLVGLALAVAAHLFGMFVKQMNYFLRADDGTRNRTGWPSLIGSLVILLLCLGLVGYARYYYLLPIRAEIILMGGTPPALAMQIGSLLLGNIVVFLLGAAFTFMLHDVNPEYSDKRRNFLALQKRKAIRRGKGVDKQLNGIERQYKENVEKLRRGASTFNSSTEFSQVNSNVSKINAKDNKVIGLLSQYREKLYANLPDDVRIRVPFFAGDRSGAEQILSKDDFRAVNSRLSWGE